MRKEQKENTRRTVHSEWQRVRQECSRSAEAEKPARSFSLLALGECEVVVMRCQDIRQSMFRKGQESMRVQSAAGLVRDRAVTLVDP